MSLLKTLGTGQGFLKAGFLGFAGAGKTYTAMLLAIGTRRHFGLKGPLVLFDTEGGSEYIAPLVRRETGLDLLGIRARSFSEMMGAGKETVEIGGAVYIVDSISHVWVEVMESHMAQINEGLARRKLPLRKRLEFQDMAELKRIWEEWTTFYLNSPLHIIVCGRAGFIWNFEKDEETGKKELVKEGIKMKVENDFSFEPSLLVEMERDQEPDGHGGFRLKRKATIIKDRFGLIDGTTMLNPTYDFFKPHVEALTRGAHAPVDTSLKTDTGASEDDGDGAWHREKRTRAILCEEIQGELVNAYPSQSAEHKKAKTDLVHEVFGTRSWTAVESMDSGKLREGLRKIRAKLGVGEPPVEEKTDGEGKSGERESTEGSAAGRQEAQGADPAVQNPPADPAEHRTPAEDAGGAGDGRGPDGGDRGAPGDARVGEAVGEAVQPGGAGDAPRGNGQHTLSETVRSLKVGEVRGFADQLDYGKAQWDALFTERNLDPVGWPAKTSDDDLLELHRTLGQRVREKTGRRSRR